MHLMEGGGDHFQTALSPIRQNHFQKRINVIQSWTDPISLA